MCWRSLAPPVEHQQIMAHELNMLHCQQAMHVLLYRHTVVKLAHIVKSSNKVGILTSSTITVHFYLMRLLIQSYCRLGRDS